MRVDPAIREANVGWDLRDYWARLREVVLVLEKRRLGTHDVRDAPADRPRVRGYITHVAATNAFCLIWDGQDVAHVPLALIATVRRSHFHEPLDGAPVAPPGPREPLTLPGQLAFDLGAA